MQYEEISEVKLSAKGNHIREHDGYTECAVVFRTTHT